MLESKITRNNIEKMVKRFYNRILKDDLVGPYFIHELGDDMDNRYWKPHLKLLVDFWASLVLGENAYQRNPLGPHTLMDELTPEVFARWLKLFFKTLDEVYEADIADIFKEKGTTIAKNFMCELGLI